MNKVIYEFDEFQLDPGQKSLRRDGERIALQPRVFDVLVALVERHGELVSRDELMDSVWADTFVEESNLRFCIHSLRKVLGNNAQENPYIETIPKRGYRFVGAVSNGIVEQNPVVNGNAVLANKPVNQGVRGSASRRTWLVAVSAVGIVTIAAIALAWFRQTPQAPKNSLGISTVAVLPFVRVGDQVRNDTDFQAGLADAMITAVSKIKQLKVVPISAVQKVVGQDFDALIVGQELRADSVLEGSYRQDADEIRVTSRLLRVENGEVLWANSFVAPRSSGLRLEDFVSLRIARLLSLKISDGEELPRMENIDPEAVRNYVEGRRIWVSREFNRRPEMVLYFERALELAPNWSLANSGLAEALLSEDGYSIEWDRVETFAQKALELDQNNAQAHTALAQLYHRKHWNWENAEQSFKRALEIDPTYAHAHHEYAILLSIRRRFVEADKEIRAAIELEPFSPFYYGSLCKLSYYDHRYDDALAQCTYAENLESDFWRTRKQLFWVYVHKKMYAELADLALSKVPEPDRPKHPLTIAISDQNFRPFWQNLIDAKMKVKNDSSKSLSLATFYLQLDEKDEALRHLEDSADQRELFLPTANADPIFDPLRNENRFAAVMHKIGL